jgi:ABC-type branched-subunit amino acid transport system permease subunit
MGMFIGFVYADLRRSGDLVLPILGLPDRIPVFTAGVQGRRALVCCGIPTEATAFTMTLIYAALLGLLVHFIVFRPLRSAPALAKVVASLGLFLYFFAMADIRFGSQGAAVGSPQPILPTETIDIAGVIIPRDRFWLTALVILVTALLWALFKYTRFGLATRAAAESEKGAVLLGHSPDRLAALNWMAASVLAGGAVILFAPIAGLNPSSTSLLIVPALAAALVGGFKSFWITTIGGLGIGMLQSSLLQLESDYSWLPSGIQLGLPFILIIVIMAVRGETLPTRGSLHVGRFPRSPRPLAVGPTAVVGVVLGSVALLTLGSEWRQGIIISTIFAVIALSVVVLTGYVGQISLAPFAFAGIAAFSMVKLTDWGVPFPLAPIGAALVAVAIGLLAGIPAVRVRGMNLAIATLAAAVAIEELLLGWDWLTGGGVGTRVPPPELFGVDLGISAVGDGFPRAAFGILCVVGLALCAVAIANLRRSPTGLRFLAVRSNERAAAAAGVDVTRTKLFAFAVSAFMAGIGGTLLAYQRQALSADSFAVFESLALLAVTYLAGIAAIGGALIAGVLAQGGLLTVALDSDSSQYQFAINGIALIAVAILYPDGVTGALYRLGRRFTPPSPSSSAGTEDRGRPQPAPTQS